MWDIAIILATLVGSFITATLYCFGVLLAVKLWNFLSYQEKKQEQEEAAKCQL